MNRFNSIIERDQSMIDDSISLRDSLTGFSMQKKSSFKRKSSVGKMNASDGFQDRSFDSSRKQSKSVRFSTVE